MNKRLFIDNERLREIRDATDWRELFDALQLTIDKRISNENDYWAISPFSSDEKKASFHINDKGWYCHSTGQGGGVVELVQKIHGCNCYEAGRWLVEHGLCSSEKVIRSGIKNALSPTPSDGNTEQEDQPPKENPPIRQDLRPVLRLEHPEFERRGIPPEVLRELGIGFLEESRGPLKERLVFQIRGVEKQEDGSLRPVILSHIGRATTEEQEAESGKWHFYAGFHKSLELYNIDKLLLDEEAAAQARDSGRVVVVEGSFDVAKLWAAGVKNVVATFGVNLSESQVPKFQQIEENLGVKRFLIFYDRKEHGKAPEDSPVCAGRELLEENGFDVEVFDWNVKFGSARRSEVGIPEEISDPCEFQVLHLQWLRNKQVI